MLFRKGRKEERQINEGWGWKDEGIGKKEETTKKATHIVWRQFFMSSG